ncbi:MAG: glutamine--fructose-6-phosphate transaminase (isomerizing) [Oscillospiraceae bacterium]|nr:glutamine--fructose-6-phosphate transaminase (isomerizing) [Oscillospiraceae bacterium]
MCGIVGFTGKQSAAPILLDGLKKLEYRGYDSAGIAVMDGNTISVSKVRGRIANLCEKTGDGASVPGSTGIGHTRWATHGAPTEENAHPHLSNDGRFAVVHNGIIENYMALREELIRDGYRFQSETDTEVIVHLIEMYYRGNVRDALIKTANRLRGSYALGVICSEEPGRIYAVREASPLILGIGMEENFFASDVTALVNHTRNVVYLEDGEFAELSGDEIRIFDCTGREINKKASRISWDVQAAEKGGYDHFMLKEIMEQPAAVKAAIAPRIKNGKIDFDELGGLVSELPEIRKIVITACGSAYYAGCAGKYALERLCRIPVETQLASELRYSDPLIDGSTLLIVISQSGETADTIAAMKECKSRGARTLAVVNVVGSSIASLADYTVYTWAGPEIAVATTKGYTTQISVLYMLALFFAERLGRLGEDAGGLIGQLQALPRRIQQAIDMNPSIPALAMKYHESRALFFIGRNTDYAVALEGALKMKEISYLHAEAYAAGELKHGTIALIEEHQPVIALCCNPSVMEKTLSNIVEVKSRGAEVLALTFRNNHKILSAADDLLFIPDADALFSAVIEIVPLQLLAYYVAKANGCDIDKPKNLAKSVTVE